MLRLFLVVALAAAFAPPHARLGAPRRGVARRAYDEDPDATLLLSADAAVILASQASQKIVDSLNAGESLFSPITVSDFDGLPALVMTATVWTACWFAAGRRRGAFAWYQEPGTAGSLALATAVDAATLYTVLQLAQLALLRTPIDFFAFLTSAVGVAAWLTVWRVAYASMRRF